MSMIGQIRVQARVLAGWLRLAWLGPVYGVVLVLAAGVLAPGWRTPVEALQALDPAGPHWFWRDPPLAALGNVLGTAGLFAPLGFMVWLRRGRMPGGGMLAGGIAATLSLVVQLLRWLKPGLVPDPNAPLIAGAAAWIVWRLLPVRRAVWPAAHPRWRAAGLLLLAWCLLGGVLGAGGAVYGIVTMQIAPRQLAFLIDAHAAGHPGPAGRMAALVSSSLDRLDRVAGRTDAPFPAWAGANESHDGILPDGRLRSIASVDELRQALGNAQPGDVLELQPGTYRIDSANLAIYQPGTPTAPITLRAAHTGQAVIETSVTETFKLSAPDWHFENLTIRGVCPDDTACEHAFHIVGGAERTLLRNLVLQDFNAQIKINSEQGRFPDGGRIEFSTLLDSRPRRTGNPVVPVDLDAASGWTIADTLIADFVKADGDRISYGGYAKAAARDTRFLRNVVLCEWHLRDRPGAPLAAGIGLSFGGGGSSAGIHRDLGRSGYEAADGAMRDNLIAFCSDAGIYINRAPGILLSHNTLLDTAGIDVRFPESLVRSVANLVDGPIRTRDGGLLWQDGDLSEPLLPLYAGLHPVRAVFVDPARMDLRWRALPVVVPPLDDDTGAADLCGQSRPSGRLIGAFSDFRACGQSEAAPMPRE